MNPPGCTPQIRFSPELLLKAQDIRMVLFDVDGVLTDGGLYFSDAGETLKRFHTLDGHGLKLLQRVGITPAVVTGRDSPALRRRLEALGIVHVRYGTEQKQSAAESILASVGLGWSVVASMGDDWPDLPMLRQSALAVAPPHAHAEVRGAAHHITAAPAGHGAVRELCDALLMAQGYYGGLLDEASR